MVVLKNGGAETLERIKESEGTYAVSAASVFYTGMSFHSRNYSLFYSAWKLDCNYHM